jgi:Mg-chelatase subunit ChlD
MRAVAVIVLAGAVSAVAQEDNRNRLGEERAPAARAARIAAASPTVVPGSCAPLDLVLVIDDTGSMGPAITSVKDGLAQIIETALVVSSNDLRLGLVAFKDSVTVHNALTADIEAVKSSVNALSAGGGAGGPEASDEAKNTVVNNLPAGTRNDSAGNPGTQIGDFSTPYRPAAHKIVVLVTDAPPAGFNDNDDPADRAAMHTHAVTAKSKGIVISDVFVPTGGDYAGQKALLEDDAVTSGGIFTETDPVGTGTGNAIDGIVAACPVASVPTLSEWGMIIMALLLALSGIARLRGMNGPRLGGGRIAF